MVSHEENAGPVTVVNMFKIDPDKLEAFIAVWPELVESMSEQPGFRSFRLLRALLPEPQFQLINVAEWDSAEELHAAMSDPTFNARVSDAIDEFGVSVHPGLYSVVVEDSMPL